jgi:phosphatidylserine/phosphatidylglycerophosphate/cardiolipin synthase-like enzyme
VASGPRSTTLHSRSTEQILLGLIAEAQHEILLVTFALQGYDDLRDAVRQAVARGVRVRVLAEDPDDAPGFYGDPVRALAGIPVERLRWPRERRSGRGAALHAKVVVVDRGAVLVTSANLTQRASEDNFEVGLLLRGDVGGRLARHIDELVVTGVFR